MDDVDPIDPDLVDFGIRLCTRIGMMMEDVSPLAINASRDGLEGRVAEVVGAISAMTRPANAVEILRKR